MRGHYRKREERRKLRERVVALSEEKLTQKVIARRTGISQGEVSKTLKGRRKCDEDC